jgi:hypothetical protein
MTIRTTSIWLLASHVLALPSMAQDPGRQTAPPDFPVMEEVVWAGLEPANVYVGEDLIGDRAIDPQDKALEAFFRLNDVYVKFVADNLKAFDGAQGQRDAGFQAVNLVMVTGVVWPPTLAALGGTIGGAVGAAEGSIVPGAGTAAGVAIGGGIGVTAGGAVGTGAMCMQLLLAVKLAMDVNDKYPEVGDRGIELPDTGSEPEAWIAADLAAELATVNAIGAGGDSDAVADRDLGGDRQALSTTSRLQAYAGQWESIFVHSVAEMVGPKVHELANGWDRMPGLTTEQKQQLAQAAGLRRVLQELSYICANQRLRGGKPAIPLSTWQSTGLALLRADQSAVQQVWLGAFGLANTKIAVDGSQVAWSTPKALRELGAPSKFESKIPAMAPKVSGLGGYLAAKITPGKFSVDLHGCEVKGDSIRVGFRIGAGKLFTVEAKGALGPAEQELAKFTPQLSSTLTGFADYKVQGYGLALDRVSLGKVSLSVGFPKLPAMLTGLQGLADQIENEVQQAISNVLQNHLGFAGLFQDLSEYAPQRLLDILNATALEHGVVLVSKLKGFRLHQGRLEAQVEATTWKQLPTLRDAPRLAEAAARVAR